MLSCTTLRKSLGGSPSNKNVTLAKRQSAFSKESEKSDTKFRMFSPIMGSRETSKFFKNALTNRSSVDFNFLETKAL